jgi:serine protease inhibitor
MLKLKSEAKKIYQNCLDFMKSTQKKKSYYDSSDSDSDLDADVDNSESDLDINESEATNINNIIRNQKTKVVDSEDDIILDHDSHSDLSTGSSGSELESDADVDAKPKLESKLRTNKTSSRKSLKITPQIENTEFSNTEQNLENQHSLNLTKYYYENSNKKVLISAHSILCMLWALYSGSEKQSYQMFRKFFSNNNTRNVYTKLLDINTQLKASGCVFMSNHILIRNDVELKLGYVDKIKNLANVFVFSFDKDNNVQITDKYGLENNSNLTGISALADIKQKEQIKGVFSIDDMNEIIKSNTLGNIKNVLNKNTLSQNTKILLYTTTTFDNKLAHRFKRQYTEKKKFHGAQFKKLVCMMQQYNGVHSYYEDSNLQLLEMDYENESFSLGIMLVKLDTDPKKQKANSNITLAKANVFNSKIISEAITKLQDQKIQIINIPKFTIEKEYLLMNSLNGLEPMFKNCNLSKMTTKMSSIGIQNIVHRVQFSLNEDGYESETKLNQYNSKNGYDNTENIDDDEDSEIPIEFIADRPFLYYVRHKVTNTFVYTGIYR